MRRSWIPLLLLALAAVLLLRLLGEDLAPDGGPPGGAAGPGAAAVEGPAPAEAAADPELQRLRSAAVGGEDDEKGVPAAAISGRVLEVLVVEENETTPVPGARVWMADDRTRQKAGVLTGMRRSRFEAIRRSGFEARTGRDGRALVPWPLGSFTVLAEAAGRAGLALREELPEEGPLVVVLHPSPAVEVEVLDAAGAPAPGVPVALVQVHESGPVGNNLPFVSAVTDDEGHARLPDLAPALVARRDLHLEVQAVVPVEPRPALRLDPEALPEEPVVLHLPPCGRLVVRVLDFGGGPAPPGTEVVAVPEPPPDLPLPLLESLFTRHTPVPTQGGRAVFPWTGLGQEILVAARMPTRSVPLQKSVQGPVAAGEEVEVVLQPESPGTWITGIALDAEGRPLARRRLRARLGGFPERIPYPRIQKSSPVPTGPEGRFLLPVPERQDDEEWSRRFLILAQPRPGHRGWNGAAWVDLPLELPPGRHDLGPLRLLEGVVLAAGTVVDAAGDPVEGARVRFETAAGLDLEEKLLLRSLAEMVLTDEAGRFRFLSPLPPGPGVRLRVRAEHAGREAAAETEAGREDLLLRLAGETRLIASVLVDAGLAPGDLRARAIPLGDSLFSSLNGDWDGNEVVWTGLEAGSWRVEFRDATGRLLHGVDEVLVVEGQDNRDPRLQSVDLRGRLRRITIRCVDETGRPLLGVLVHPLLEEGQTALLPIRTPADGVASFLSAGPAPLVLCRLENRRIAVLRDVQHEAEAVLPPAPWVEARVEGLPPAPEGSVFRLVLDPQGTAAGLRFHAEGTLDAEGRTRLRLPLGGAWKAALGLDDRSGDNSHLLHGILEPELLQIADPEHAPLLLLRADTQELRRLLTR